VNFQVQLKCTDIMNVHNTYNNYNPHPSKKFNWPIMKIIPLHNIRNCLQIRLGTYMYLLRSE